MKFFRVACIAFCSLTVSSAAVLFDRGLPGSTNVNDVAGANRSNVSWETGVDFQGDHFLVGDDFSFSSGALVDSITVYVVGSIPLPNANILSDQFSGLTLYYGEAGLLDLSQSTFTSSTVTYQPGGENYQGSGGNFYSIYALTFGGLNWSVNSGTTYGFALDGTAVLPDGPLVIHASNAALSGTTQQGADNLFRYYIVSGGQASFDSFCDTSDANTCGGWNKTSDINVVIQGTPSVVPEPGTWMLLTAGLAGLIARKRLS